MDNYQKLFGKARSIVKLKADDDLPINRLVEVLNNIHQVAKEKWYLLGNIGCQFYVNKQYDDALKYLNEAIELCPNHAIFIWARANVKEDMNNLAGAIEDFRKSIEISDSYSKYFQVGFCFYKLKQDEKAIIAYDIAIDLKSRIANEENVPYFSLGIPIKTPMEIIFNNRALSKANLNRSDEAIEDFTTAISYNPTYKNAFFGRGATKLRDGNQIEAVEDLMVAAKLGFQPAINLLNEL